MAASGRNNSNTTPTTQTQNAFAAFHNDDSQNLKKYSSFYNIGLSIE